MLGVCWLCWGTGGFAEKPNLPAAVLYTAMASQEGQYWLRQAWGVCACLHAPNDATSSRMIHHCLATSEPLWLRCLTAWDCGSRLGLGFRPAPDHHVLDTLGVMPWRSEDYTRTRKDQAYAFSSSMLVTRSRLMALGYQVAQSRSYVYVYLDPKQNILLSFCSGLSNSLFAPLRDE